MKTAFPGKKNREVNNSLSANAWMTTFSDLVTLLLTFFVLLFSLSSMDDRRLKIAFQHFSSSAGFLSFNDYRKISSPRETLIEGLNMILGEKVVYDEEIGPEDMPLPYDNNSIGDSLYIQILEDGIKLSFGETLLFPPGGTDVRKEMLPVLGKIARFILISDYQTYVDGHTDDIPVRSGRFASNEEISIARAVNVRYHLINQGKLPPGSVVINGYGDLRPVANNKTAEGRAKNRRVEIILKNQKYF
ncbi:MAG: flagellar motor protein MotB [Deltaproteobacteria bacterium]|nr:flagellar motor protein MotB [Deltaproteobacteria bacterium]